MFSRQIALKWMKFSGRYFQLNFTNNWKLVLSNSGMKCFTCDELLYIRCIPDDNKLWRLRWLGSDHFVELKILLEDPKSTHDLPNSWSDDPEQSFILPLGNSLMWGKSYFLTKIIIICPHRTIVMITWVSTCKITGYLYSTSQLKIFTTSHPKFYQIYYYFRIIGTDPRTFWLLRSL